MALGDNLALADGVVVERVGSDLAVVIPGRGEALLLSGEAAQLVADVATGHKVSPHAVLVEDLVGRGILKPPGLTRRNLVRAGAMGAGASIAVLALPGVAVASSSEGDEGGGGDDSSDGSLRFGGAGIDNGDILRIRFYVKDDSQLSGIPNLANGATGTLTLTLDPVLAPFTVTWVSAGADSGFENTTDVYAGRSAVDIVGAPRSLEFELGGETVTLTS